MGLIIIYMMFWEGFIMNTYQFNALNNSLIKELAELFIERQKEEITFFPFLEGALLKKEDVESRFEAMFRDEKVIGLGAFKKDEMIAFLLGEVHIHHKENYIRVPYHGIALKKGESLELLRMLYQKLSTEWIKEECFHHQVYLPLGDANYEKAFTHLSFAKEQIYALLDMNDYHPFHCQTDIKIHIANQQDGDVMEHMADIIFKYQNQAPVF